MAVPQPGRSAPRWGNLVTRGIGRAALRVSGWEFEGSLPDEPRLVAIAAPHTSTTDVFLGLAVILALGLRVRWLGKHTIFWPPLGAILRWLGGIPVNRSAASGLVRDVAGLFGREAQLYLGMAPEGTRKRVERWKSGFYRIAVAAGVPIVPVALDYSCRRVRIGDQLVPTGDYHADLARLRGFFRASMARHRERYAES